MKKGSGGSAAACSIPALRQRSTSPPGAALDRNKAVPCLELPRSRREVGYCDQYVVELQGRRAYWSPMGKEPSTRERPSKCRNDRNRLRLLRSESVARCGRVHRERLLPL